VLEQREHVQTLQAHFHTKVRILSELHEVMFIPELLTNIQRFSNLSVTTMA
jgi:hypothetical protein